MHNNIIYHSFNEGLLKNAETAFIQKNNNELYKLKEISQKSLDIGAKTEDSLLKDLRITTNLKQSREKISGAIESHHIKETLNSIEKKRGEVKTPTEILDVLEKKQNYLCNIGVKLQHPEYLDKDLSNIISLSQLEKEERRLGSLNKLVAFVVNEKLHDDTEIAMHLKRPVEIKSVIENITTSYQTKYLQNIDQNLTSIEKQGHVLLEKQSFNCPIKYLDHEKKHSKNNEYSAHQDLDKIYQKTIAKQELENTKLQIQSENKGMDFER
jgi:hypothetical protein